jgi:hypothetical protein
MFSFLNKNRIPINPIFRDYYMNLTKKSVRLMSAKHNFVRDFKKQIECSICNDNSSLPNNNNDLIIPILCFLSSSTILYYFIRIHCKYVFFY